MLTTLLLLSGAKARRPRTAKADNRQRASDPSRSGRRASAALAALSQDIATDLIWIIDHATQPPWAGIRAARCI